MRPNALKNEIKPRKMEKTSQVGALALATAHPSLQVWAHPHLWVPLPSLPPNGNPGLPQPRPQVQGSFLEVPKQGRMWKGLDGGLHPRQHLTIPPLGDEAPGPLLCRTTDPSAPLSTCGDRSRAEPGCSWCRALQAEQAHRRLLGLPSRMAKHLGPQQPHGICTYSHTIPEARRYSI